MADMNTIYKISQKIVSRVIEGELLIVPIEDGFTENRDEIFSLNETGTAVWQKIDGKNSVSAIVSALSHEFKAPVENIKQDVLSLLAQLAQRDMIIQRESI